MLNSSWTYVSCLELMDILMVILTDALFKLEQLKATGAPVEAYHSHLDG